MPQLLAAALLAAFPILGITGAAILSYAIVIGAYYAYGSYQAKAAREAARASFNSTLKDRLVMTATTDAPRSRIYGRCRNVDGIVYKATHGDKKQFYTFVVALAGHEVDAVEDVWFADQKVALDGSGYVLTAPYAQLSQRTETAAGALTNGAGSITLAHPPVAGSVAVLQTLGQNLDVINISLAVTVSGSTISYSGGDPAYDTVGVTASYQWAESSQNARVRSYLGSPGQDLSGALIALGISGVTAAHKFQGMACLLVTLTYSVDAFPQGVPNFSATMRGARVFDPRTGSTAWTRNPALIARDWSTYQYGGGALASDIDDTILIASANACDVSTTFQTATPVTEATYFADLVAPTLTDPTNTLNEIVSAMAGKYAWCGGRLRIRAGAYSAPVASIDETWASGAGSIEITAGVPRIDLVNIYRPSIADASKGYVVTPTLAVRAQPYITADGQELPRDITLFAVTDFYHAQHVCGAMLRDSRQALTIKMPCNMKAYPVEVFDVVAVTLPFYGWAAKLFEVVSWNYSPTGGVILTMKETAAAIWTPSTTFAAQDDAPNTNLPLPWVVPQVTGVSVTSGTALLTDLSIITRTRVAWTPLVDASITQSGAIEVTWAEIATTLVWHSTEEPGDATSTILPGLKARGAYVFKARARNTVGVRGPWSVQVAAIIAPAPIVAVDWTTLAGRPQIFRVLTYGGAATGVPAGPLGLSNESGTAIAGAGRSYALIRLRRSDGAMTWAEYYDVYGGGTIGGRSAATLAADLNATGNDSIVVLYTFDEPAQNRFNSALGEAMFRCGASRGVFGSPQFQPRSAYCLIGIGGCGEGNGFEAYQGAIANDPNAWIDVAFMLKGGNLIVTGSSATPRTLADYSYVGTLDATTDLSLIGRGGVVVAGNYARRLTGGPAWDADCYSRDSSYGACFASFVVDALGGSVMGGLNTDPTTDSGYTSIDYAWYKSGTNYYIYESGSLVFGPLAGVAVGDVLSVVYDGSRVNYLLNGRVKRQIAAPNSLTLFFDSSFYEVGATLRNIRFGQLSANDWASIGNVNVTTPQIATNAATDLVQAVLATHTLQITSTDPQLFETVLFSTTYTNPTSAPIALEVHAAGSHRIDAGSGAVDVYGETYLAGSINGAAFTALSATAGAATVTNAGFFTRWNSSLFKAVTLPGLASIVVQMRVSMSANPAGGPTNGYGTGTYVTSSNMSIAIVAIKR